MDFFSYSPSLLEILQFVDNQDILNSRLNKRVTQVIENNYSILSRKEISITLSSLVASPQILIIEDNTEHVLYLKDGFTTIQKISPERNDNDFLDEFVRELNKPLQKRETTEKEMFHEYINQGIDDELRTVFSFIFRRYHISTLTLESYGYIPEKWLNVISDAHFKTRSRCSTVAVLKPIAGLKHLCETLSSTIYYDAVLRFFSYDDLITSLNWKVPVRIRNLSISCLFRLFETWEIGELSLTDVELIYGVDTNRVIMGFLVKEALRRFKHATLLPTKDGENLTNAYVDIQRSIDKKILRIQSSEETHINSIVNKEL